VLRLIARGHSNRQIARDLAIGEQTVKTHVRSIRTKPGRQDRVQAAIFALRHRPGPGADEGARPRPGSLPRWLVLIGSLVRPAFARCTPD
jgi:hypothetical protein